MPNGKSRIIVTELPYMVNKARLIEKMADLVREKRIDGITAITDESNGKECALILSFEGMQMQM